MGSKTITWSPFLGLSIAIQQTKKLLPSNNMKQKQQQKLENQHPDNQNTEKHQLEIHKAVAQAWHSHFTYAREATSEFDVRRRNFQTKPSRFKLEATAKLKKTIEANDREAKWDFTQSLWDSYEIVAVSKRLETGLILDGHLDEFHKVGEDKRVFKRIRESKNSLRNLFNLTSRRFNEVDYSRLRSM